MKPFNQDPLELAKHFAWQLREDVQKAIKPQDLHSDAFNEWWLLKGRSEYPGWRSLSIEDQRYLAEEIGTLKIDTLSLPIPRALSLAIKWRPDVLKQFTKDGQLDQIGIAAWFYSFGIHEMCLEEILTPQSIQLLDSPAVHPQDLNSEVPSATLLMRLSWQLLSPELRKAMPLENDKTRARYIAWFFTNASKHFKLSSLISNRWKAWLKQEVKINKTLTLPRFVIQELSVSKELNDRFDLKTNEGAQKLKEWSMRVSRKDGHWSWLNDAHKAQPLLPKKEDFGVNLYGFAFGELGIGEDLRMAVEACESAGIPYRVVNVDVGAGARQADQALKAHVAKAHEEAPYKVNIFCLPGFDMVSRIFLQWGMDYFNDHYNVGWWPWELSVWPAAWQSAFDLMDELWAGSEFSCQMYLKASKLPTHHMPLPVSVDRAKSLKRQRFHLPKQDFLFLYVFDFNSHLTRKNPQAVIEAFSLAFHPSQRQVGLVMKVMNAQADHAEWQAFLAQCQQDQRIHIIQETMDRPDILGLIDCCDAYVSLHRCEGFGRTLAEAMCFGKPVIATNYSGNVDFMAKDLSYPVEYRLVPLKKGEYHFIEDRDQAVWAEPDTGHAAKQMQQAMRDSKHSELTSKIKAYAKTQFSAERIGALMRSRLQEIESARKTINQE